MIDFERLRAQGTVKLYLCATNVRTGRLRVPGRVSSTPIEERFL